MNWTGSLLLFVIVAVFNPADSCTIDSDCQHGAMCYDGFCECLTGFMGSECSGIGVMTHNPCQHGGSCTIGTSPCECECTDEYSGDRCEQKDECFHDHCNGGGCISYEHIHECTNCPENQSGFNCQIYDGCINDPCSNGGICQQEGNTGFTCTCTDQYWGETCEYNSCSGDPCGHGTCEVTGNDSGYNCTCDYGYLLPNCQTFSICNTIPGLCQNGGTCVDDEMSYYCVCPTNYLGADCATINPCASQPCEHGGTCIIVGSTYLCGCNLGYSGDNCDVSETVHCGFEGNDLCFFLQVLNGNDGDSFDWSFGFEKTPSSSTGPNEAPEGTGYMFIETSYPKVQGDYAMLASPTLTGNAWCLYFLYSMYGRNIDRLSVSTQRVVGSTTDTEVWYEQGNKMTRNWYQAAVDLSDTEDFRFAFKAVRGNGYRGDIAIDDVYIQNGTCY